MADAYLYTNFDALSHDYPHLLHGMPEADFFRQGLWFQALDQYARSWDGELRLMPYLDQRNQNILCLPMVSRGRQLHSLSNYYSSRYGPLLLSKSIERNDLPSLSDCFQRDRKQWPIVQIQPIATDHPDFLTIQSALSSAGYFSTDFFCFRNWYLKVNGRTYREYLATRPSALQNTLKRAEKKRMKSDLYSQIKIYKTPGTELDQAIEDFQIIYSQSWKPPETYPEFIRNICQRCAAEGQLRLGVFYLDKMPLAAQIWFVNNKQANIFKLAYREGKNPFSVGSLLTAALMENVIDEDQVDTVDYLTGDEPYKQDWMSDSREYRGILAFNLKSPKSWPVAIRHLTGKLLSSRQ